MTGIDNGKRLGESFISIPLEFFHKPPQAFFYSVIKTRFVLLVLLLGW
ncbi:hypothetical protein [Actinomyces viscosus]|nr:hypothetical protein [Actinomyces viscosus]